MVMRAQGLDINTWDGKLSRFRVVWLQSISFGYGTNRENAGWILFEIVRWGRRFEFMRVSVDLHPEG